LLLEIDPERPRPRQINKVADVLRRGEIIVYPTSLTRKQLDGFIRSRGSIKARPSVLCVQTSET